MSYLSWASCGNFNRSGLTAEENLLNTESTLPRLEVRRSVLWSIKYRDKFNKASLFLRFRIKNVLNTYLVQWIEKRLLLKFWRTGSIIFCGDMAACATFNWTVTINLRVVTAEVNVNYTSQDFRSLYENFCVSVNYKKTSKSRNSSLTWTKQNTSDKTSTYFKKNEDDETAWKTSLYQSFCFSARKHMYMHVDISATVLLQKEFLQKETETY